MNEIFLMRKACLTTMNYADAGKLLESYKNTVI